MRRAKNNFQKASFFYTSHTPTVHVHSYKTTAQSRVPLQLTSLVISWEHSKNGILISIYKVRKGKRTLIMTSSTEIHLPPHSWNCGDPLCQHNSMIFHFFGAGTGLLLWLTCHKCPADSKAKYPVLIRSHTDWAPPCLTVGIWCFCWCEFCFSQMWPCVLWPNVSMLVSSLEEAFSRQPFQTSHVSLVFL